MDERLNVTVVGGSIAGCAVAAELLDAGHDVTVHERSPGPLSSQGIGIYTPAVVFDGLVARRLIDPAVPRVNLSKIRYVHRTDSGEPGWLGDVAVSGAALSWSGLFAGLRDRLPDSTYRGGSSAAVTADAQLLVDGVPVQPDLAVFADGHASVGRRVLAPWVQERFGGLVLWRGLVSEQEVDVSAYEGMLTRVVYSGGHGVIYLIPGVGPDGAHSGQRMVLWAFYLPTAPEDLVTVLTDRAGRPHTGSVATGRTDETRTAALRDRVVPVVPDFCRELIDRAVSTSLQAIREVPADLCHRDHQCLIGDAAAVFSPFSGTGVLKAVGDAVSLRECLDGASSITEALAAHEVRWRETSRRAQLVAEAVRHALVDAVPDFATATRGQRNQWIAAIHPGAPARLPSEEITSPAAG